ncbi:MAG: polysaccharide biosynthesis tyrosine autokinase [Planctomycetes bacterium]|nr:polysaccharide biosynthesis tyrosine autokinase [Planctomycetota bacterium]
MAKEAPKSEKKTEADVRIQEYVWVLQNRRWLIIGCAVVSAVLVLVLSIGKKPRYSATVQIQIDPARTRETLKRVEAPPVAGYEDRAYLETQFELLKSDPLCDAVINDLRLDQVEEFNSTKPESITDYVRKWTNGLLHMFDEPVSDPEQIERGKRANRLRRFHTRLSVSPIEGSRLVEISFWSYQPKLAADVANAIAKKHIELDLKRRLGSLEDVFDYLEKQQEAYRKSMMETEEKFQKYRREHDIVGLDDQKNIVAKKLQQLNLDLLEAENRLRRAETSYNKLVEVQKAGGVIEAVPEIAENHVLQDLKANYLKLLLKKEEYSKRYGPKHPKMIALNAQITMHKEKVDREIKLAEMALKNKYENAAGDVKRLRAALEEEKKRERDLAEKGIQYKVLQRELESNEEVFKEVLGKVKESAGEMDYHTSNIKVVVPATIPPRPTNLHRIRNLFMGIVLGVGLGVGLAFFLEYLDNSIRTIEDIEEHIELPFLGPIAKMEGKIEDDWPKTLVAQHEPESQVAEGFRTVRTNIIFSTSEESRKTLMVTSATPREGKTTVAANLAVVLARTGRKVLLVDADMRRPNVHRLFDLENPRGLSSILTKQEFLCNAVQESGIENLTVLTAGPVPANQTELLGSAATEEFLKEAQKTYDIILFDSPPVGSVSDAVILSKYVGGIVVVIGCGGASRWIIRRAVQQLRDVEAKLIGVVLNNVDMLRDGYARYHYYRYYRDYAEGGKKEKQDRQSASKEA